MTRRRLFPALLALGLALAPATGWAGDPLTGAALNRALANRLAEQKTTGKEVADPEVKEVPQGVIPPSSTTGIAQAENGDTLIIGLLRFRLWGIAAPRLDEFGGYTSQQGLVALLNGAKTTCTATGARSSEGFPLARCIVDGRDLADEQVRGGFARDCPRQSLGTYAATERQAVVDVAGGFDLPLECLED